MWSHWKIPCRAILIACNDETWKMSKIVAPLVDAVHKGKNPERTLALIVQQVK
jgi:hypothetical protein